MSCVRMRLSSWGVGSVVGVVEVVVVVVVVVIPGVMPGVVVPGVVVVGLVVAAVRSRRAQVRDQARMESRRFWAGMGCGGWSWRSCSSMEMV